MVIGTPCSKPSSSPLARALSAAFAALSASPERSTTTALSFGLTARMRATWASVTSRQETTPDRIAAAVSTADHCQIGGSGRCALAGFRNPAFLIGFASPSTRVLVDFFANLFFEVLFRLTALLAKVVSPSLLCSRSYGGKADSR